MEENDVKFVELKINKDVRSRVDLIPRAIAKQGYGGDVRRREQRGLSEEI